MPATTATAITPELVVKSRKYPVVAFFIIVQPFHKHFLLGRKPIVPRRPHVFIDLLKTILTKTIKIRPGQEITCLRTEVDPAALAVADVAHLTSERPVAFWTVFLLVFIHLIGRKSG